MNYKNVLISALLPVSFLVSAQRNFDIIPKPSSVAIGRGEYVFPAKVKVNVSPEFDKTLALISEYPAFKNRSAIIPVKSGQGDLNIVKVNDPQLNPGAYKLKIDKKGILIQASDVSGAINGIHTLIQLGLLQEDSSRLTYSVIEDKPRFSYRGLHLDVSRHFFPLSFVKKYIDLMALYKFNNFHWHLTDGAGWRLQIKKYPELTNKAAWRTHTVWKDWWQNGRQYIEEGKPNASGGYYTQEEAKELVKYAADRGINVIPEIEMPGHSEEVLAVYPELSCSGKPYTQSEFCIGNPKTFEFLQGVIDEVLEIFPSKYIHIGGDEADKNHWKNCPKDQALMKKEGLKSVDELQSFAIRKMDKYLQSRGRILVGWDEILDGGLTPGAVVMSWRGESGGIKAANAGHDVIMTPGEFLYFDSYQTDPRTQPEAIGGFLPLEKVYSYNPVPSELNKENEKHVLGAQANLWAEYIPTTNHVEYMVFPRALALAEVNWTPKENKNVDDFKKRLQSHYMILQKLQVNYYRPSYNINGIVAYDENSGINTVTLKTEQFDASNIKYTTDGTEPTENSFNYKEPLIFTTSGKLKAAYFMKGIKVGPVLEMDIDKHKAIGKKVIYNNKWDGYEAQKEKTLTNGVFGGLTYHDKQWQGFTRDLDVVVDFEKKEIINSIAMRFMQITGPGVYMPGEMKILSSDDGVNFKELGVVKNDIPDTESKLTFKRFELKLKTPVQTRFLRIIAPNTKKGYLFTDEIIVY
ncbi:beta-N-acetylhexosaminidase [Elizabethkingia meningoseptica]|uniref:glycoside hydrolase family 20 protein n=1 Tax=Elizabethkingia meningoseptica TaxID=238 RepID=UPI000332C19A|nr:family 20 glycosylhydrolase [Elizabethkingia meningoseptica]AQX05763.1 beta-N-acetylhexosaminidase [Elizabethkingia meningoseptica]AQX47806.1 beta-N-acetylhexosaminidase [Elizabethkingia meningoseptica]EOR28493.1 beta-N-acetylhexosaminidase [Elizabethkingia meningoseptica ATCC 13253 = NBRC 12535]KUY23930.1 beta-N-acetylhexosaminidase [Elizabethkingia meningoseptica]OPB67872.1 beta-N-acetylhexosaminidase [Elizabethkingia meningoseptica]